MNEATIFAAALDRTDPMERAAFLTEACAGDDRLRRRVEALLKAHAEPDEILDAPPRNPSTADYAPISEKPGTMVGPYKLMEQIGEGGFGLVFVAEQQRPVKRMVALKVIKPGMDSKQVIARFEAERQALAMMDHPNIARVLDAGTTESGLPYFVMELVRGIPITDYCDKSQLTPKERLELFLSVCHAIQHAHQKSIIHRDIKPSNVLATSHDGKPVAKVIDFGVAKAINQQLTERSIYTNFAQMIGTPLYMSPEQADMSGLDIDTRTDIYSLGVLLYELLTGTTPLDKKRFAKAAYDEIRRMICEEEPPKPSTRLSTSDSIASIAAKRHTEPARLSKLMKGELDWVVMKALEKDRIWRYETVNALSRDIQRYLADEVVEARPPSAGYRLKKFVRRHEGQVLAASLVLLTLVAGIVVSVYLAVMAGEEAKAARTAEAEATQARADAKRESKEAKWQTRLANGARHAIQLDLALRAWERHDVVEAERMLSEVEPAFQQTWEQRHLRDLCRRKVLRLRGHAARIMAVMFSADGQRMVSQSSDGMVKVWDTATGQEKRTLRCEAGEAINLAFSADGRRLATRHLGGTWKVWDAITGEEKLTLKAHQGVEHGLGSYSTRIAFSPDGRWIAAGKSDGTVRVWDAATGQEKLPLKGVFRAFSGDGQRIATSNEFATVRIWDTATGRETMSGTVHLFAEGRGLVEDQTGEVYSAAFNPDRGSIVLGCRDSTVRVWDTATGKEKFILHHSSKGPGNPIMSVTVSADGRRIISGSEDGTVKAWDAATGQSLLTLQGQNFRLQSAAISPNGARIVSLGDSRMKAWDAETGEEKLSLPVQSLGVAFLQDGERIASGGADGKLLLWNPTVGQATRTFQAGSLNAIYSVGISPDGQLIAAGGSRNDVKAWDAVSGDEKLALEWPKGDPLPLPNLSFLGPVHVCFSPDARRLVATTLILHVLDAQTGKEVLALSGHKHMVLNAFWSLDGRRIASGSMDGTIRVWDAQTGQQERCLTMYQGGGRDPGLLAISPDGGSLVVQARDYDMTVWGPDGKRMPGVPGTILPSVCDAATGEVKFSLQGRPGRVRCSNFSPDGRRIVTGEEDGIIRVWDSATGEERMTLKGHTGAVWSVAFSWDGQQIVSGGIGKADPDHPGLGELKAWDAVTGQEKLSLKGHAGCVTGLALSRDCQRIVSCSDDRTVKVWEAPTGPEK